MENINENDLRNIPLEEPEGGVYYTYANVVNMNWTLTDIRLRFAELLQVPKEESPSWNNQDKILLERASITLPWYQARVLRDMLDGVVRSYEALNGELKQPQLAPAPELTPTLDQKG